MNAHDRKVETSNVGVDVNLCCGNDFAFVVETAKPLTPMILYVFSVKLDFAFTDATTVMVHVLIV